MKKYTIILDETLSSFYDEIAQACDKSTEEILQDTLVKVKEILVAKSGSINRE